MIFHINTAMMSDEFEFEIFGSVKPFELIPLGRLYAHTKDMETPSN